MLAKGVKNVLKRGDEWVTVVAFLFLLLFISLQILGRVIDFLRFPWTEEASRYLFMVIVFLGSTAAIRARQHIRIDIFKPKTRPVQIALLTFQTVVQLVFAGIIIWVGAEQTITLLKSNAQLVFLDLPRYLVYAIIPAAFVVFAARLIEMYIADLRDVRAGKPLPQYGVPDA